MTKGRLFYDNDFWRIFIKSPFLDIYKMKTFTAPKLLSFSCLTAAFFLLVAINAQAQQPAATPAARPSPSPKPTRTPKPPKIDRETAIQNATAEQVAEATIIIYGTRANLAQIRRTVFENGKVAITNSDGSIDNANYAKRILRGAETAKDRVRVDQKFPNVEFALVYNETVFGLLENAVFMPKREAVAEFEAHMWHSIDALLRYQENGSTIALDKREKIHGVEYYVLDVTDKAERKTRFFISTKLARVMWLQYSMNGVKYTRRFYDYRYAQGTLVPYRSVLTADAKQIEEATISSITFGQKVEEVFFEKP
jgi:hypothetical protein